jgi:hypothetical protein
MTTEAYELPALPDLTGRTFYCVGVFDEKTGELTGYRSEPPQRWSDADMREYARAAIQQERERCAGICEKERPSKDRWLSPGETLVDGVLQRCAAAIRAG